MLPKIADHARQHGIIAKKTLGQNFLFDTNLNSKIASLAGSIKDEYILEIGPGPGGLTRAILEFEPKKLIVIEKDQRCIALLQEVQKYYPALDIIEADAMDISVSNIAEQYSAGKLKIISNLPYNISTSLLISWLGQLEYIKDMTLMFQKEVADRICATHNLSEYGRLSIITSAMTIAKKLLLLSPKAFTPAPKVYSSIVHFAPLPNYLSIKEMNSLSNLTNLLFQNRRKIIRKTFTKLFENHQDLISSLEIDLNLRAENISIEDYVKIAKIMAENNI